MQTGKHAANVGSRLKLAWKPGRRHLKGQPSSRIGENPPYGMRGGIEETSASCEARSAPRSYPTNGTATLLPPPPPPPPRKAAPPPPPPGKTGRARGGMQDGPRSRAFLLRECLFRSNSA